MQTQAQVPGQAPNQATRVQQNGSSVSSQSPNNIGGTYKKPWHTEGDVALRRHVCEQILLLFKKRKPHVTPEWQQRLPDFVKRLEEALYLNAASKEEYSNTGTLEERLQSVAQRITPPKSQHGTGVMPTPGSAMMPTPGATMIPTPGSGGSMVSPGNGMNQMQTSGNGHVMSTTGTSVSKVVAPGSGGMMVPTPGIGGSLMQTASNGSPMIQTPGSGHSIVQAPGLGGLIQGGTMVTSGHGTNMTPATMGKLMQPSGHGNMYSNSGGNMLPTSGHPNAMANQQVFSGMRMSQNGQVGSGMGISQAGSQMIPTPGLPTSQSIGINPSSVGGLPLNNSGQQHYNGGSTPPGYRNLNGQLGPTLNGSVQRKGSQLGVPTMNNGIPMMGNGQHLNGGANIHNSSGYMNAAQFSNIQMQSSQGQQLRQRHPQMRMQGDGYSLSQADINGSGSLYPAASSTGLVGANMNMSSQPSKMIPVPGLPPQQGMIQQQPSPQQLHIQRTGLQQNMGMTRNQQLPMQMTKTQSMFQQQTSNIGGQKQQGVMDQSQQASFQHATSEQHQGPRTHMPSQQHAQGPSLQRQGVQPSFVNQHHLQQQQQPQRPQQQQQMQLKQNQPQQSAQLQTHQQLSSQQQQQQPQGQALSHSQTQGQGPQMQQSQLGQMLLHQAPEQQQVQQQLAQPQQLQQLQSQAQAQQNNQALLQRQQQPQQQVQRSFAQASQVLQRSQMLQQGSMAQQQHSGGVHLQQQAQTQAQLQPSTTAAISPSLGNAMAMPSDNVTNGNLSGSSNGPPIQGSETTDAQRAQQYVKQRRWLLFLRHASKCQAPEGQCQTTPHCHVARQLWSHLSTCKQERDCTYTRCTASRTLVRHYQQCREPRCPVCAPVRQILSSQNRAQASGALQPGQGQPATTSPQISGQVGSVGSPGLPLPQSGASPITGMSALSPQMSTPIQGIEADMNPPPAKRVKLESSGVQVSQQQSLLSSKAQPISSVSAQQNQMSRSQGVKLEPHAQVKMETERSGSHLRTDTQVGAPAQRQKHHTLGPRGDLGGQASGSHIVAAKSEPGNSASKQQQGNASFSAGPTTAMLSKPGKQKIVGTSLIELFTPEQIREHITGLRQWVGQSKAKAEKNQAMEQKMTDNSCHLCAVERLTFEPPPIYCTACGARIKRNSAFYTLAAGETRHYCCTACYNECRTDSVEMDGTSYPKVKLEKRRNDEETEEAWVQCDKCNLWQHQVCALFNGRRNEGGEAEYTCPQCLAVEMERGERKPLPPSAVLGAKDMPKTLLSDHLETRLARKLDAERHQRAALAGKCKEEVPGAEALVVRVVSSVDKKLEVKQRFMEMFQDEDYPTEFPYKSKVVLLFQKIEGVEVCLFGMYVQEFGVDSAHPNQRRVYLSYLDSVKYFRPDVKTASGEALRTFVYHEILIGYLEHCKKRGFSSCYIWACPPLKGEDYILYCHPEIQKTPKSDKLREWYLTMLRKAAKESIVVEVTNLYDYFFTSTGESKAKVTAARLPYFDGDYWPGAAEDMILQLQQEEEDGRKLQKKGKTKKATTTKRTAKVAGQAELPSNASDDARLMYKLGESILPMKEDFIMVHMHHSCAHCRTFIVTGQLWSCQSCPSFKLCNRCYEIEQKVDERERHRGTSKDAHVFEVFHVSDVPTDTKDKDEIMESEFFDTRQAFLSLCQGNHYQYDTLRRAKHSSMMVLYHLHNPTAPAFVATCNSCNRDIDTGQGWRCETCVDFDLCNTCKESVTHEHKLVLHSERNAQNKEARQMRVLQLRKMLELLVHASQCALQSQCDYPKCHSVKALFRHGMYCTVRASGGCSLCKRMWYLLQLHARACKEAVCRVPRCKDLKEHLRRLTHQAESRRRAAVNEMMRQRAAEAAGNTG